MNTHDTTLLGANESEQRAAGETSVPVGASLSLLDVPGFLFGSRGSIERVLHSPLAIIYGAVLVITAGFAREYDSVSLYHDPVVLLKPFTASLGIATILYVCVRIAYAVAGRKAQSKKLFLYPQRFLAAYWWTAPLAWFYAIPIENLVAEVPSVKFNLTALSIVSVWRVLLLSRVVAILFRVPFSAAFSWILLPCMAIVFVVSNYLAFNLAPIMGGLRISDSLIVVADFNMFVMVIISLIFVPVLICMVVTWIWLRRTSSVPPDSLEPPTALPARLWIIPALAMLGLTGGMCYFQPKLYHANVVEEMLFDNKVNDAIQYMTASGKSAFPQVWDPPPRFSIAGNTRIPTLDKLVDATFELKPDDWIADRLLAKWDEFLPYMNSPAAKGVYPREANTQDRIALLLKLKEIFKDNPQRLVEVNKYIAKEESVR